SKPAIEKTFNVGQQRLEQIFSNCYTESESKTLNCTDKLSAQVDDWNSRLVARMEETLSRFEQHTNAIIDKVQSLIAEGSAQIDTNSESLILKAQDVLQKSEDAIDKSIAGWKSGLTSAYEDLGNDLTQKQEQEQTHTASLLSENLEEI